MNRILEPEWLDELLPNEPRAERSRRDLQRVNLWMGHLGIMQRNLKNSFPENPPQRIVEIGAGDGTFMLRVAQHFSQWKKIEVTLVDRQNIISEKTRAGFGALGWNVKIITEDIFDGRLGECDCLMANLFLHHFSEKQLSALFEKVAAQTNFFLACEPRRSDFALAASRMIGLIGCNAVTRHDAIISVRAGFSNSELSNLWPKTKDWTLQENRAGMFSHNFVAKRKIEISNL
ncbi:MAG: class I SAM-dependent methyltransferase [Verrucomicrobiota bacterium]|nr:class I SAM-dependent methyltransferase [Verrucomicrobiota bacterium]